jgi:putative SOS response-associated peptidase YedK
MCGRAYNTYTDEELHLRYQDRKPVHWPAIQANYNFSPTQEIPILRELSLGERGFAFAKWGLIPSWAPEFKTQFSTINAQSERVFESRLYKTPVLKRRCIVPLSGFIEWKAEGEKKTKTPYKIWLKNEPIMSVAGIWETWHLGKEDEKHSFSILTTDANAFMKSIHHRMPVILEKEDEEAWLDHSQNDPKLIQKFLKPIGAGKLTMAEISKAINSPKNNRPELLEAIS